jgi:hypothetical protein
LKAVNPKLLIFVARNFYSHVAKCCIKQRNTGIVYAIAMSSSHYTFQGGEKAVIIFSPYYYHQEHSFWFLNRKPNLLNTAISRVKELFILVGNLRELELAGGETKSNAILTKIERGFTHQKWTRPVKGRVKMALRQESDTFCESFTNL